MSCFGKCVGAEGFGGDLGKEGFGGLGTFLPFKSTKPRMRDLNFCYGELRSFCRMDTYRGSEGLQHFEKPDKNSDSCRVLSIYNLAINTCLKVFVKCSEKDMKEAGPMDEDPALAKIFGEIPITDFLIRPLTAKYVGNGPGGYLQGSEEGMEFLKENKGKYIGGLLWNTRHQVSFIYNTEDEKYYYLDSDKERYNGGVGELTEDYMRKKDMVRMACWKLVDSEWITVGDLLKQKFKAPPEKTASILYREEYLEKNRQKTPPEMWERVYSKDGDDVKVEVKEFGVEKTIVLKHEYPPENEFKNWVKTGSGASFFDGT